ncbi:MAG: site-specific integrase [Solirubrobacteraceae bacterium]|nr:site-specific integrase [Solirubrobacteraceae bacterium]
MSKRVPHLIRKGHSFYFRIRIPVGLVGSYGKAELTIPLGNISQAQAAVEARRLGAEKSAEFLGKLHALGLASSAPLPPKLLTATAEESRHISRSTARALLEADEGVRIRGTRTEQDGPYFEELSDLDTAVRQALGQGSIGGIIKAFKADLAAHGRAAPDDELQARAMIREWAAERSRALSSIEARGQGLPVATPAPEAPPETLQRSSGGMKAPADKLAHELKLRDVFELWKVAKRDRPAKTVQKAATSLALFEELTGNPSLSDIKKAMGSTYRGKLLAGNLSDKSASDRLEWVLILLNFERRNYGRIAANPWEGLNIEVEREALREEWKDEEVRKLFNNPMFSEYRLPTKDHAGGVSVYWVPIIGAYTGARITEIAQLRLVDLTEEGGQFFMRFDDPESWQSVKNKWSRRTIPVHPELVRLGLLDYAADMKREGAVRLFPKVVVSEMNNAGGGLSRWFSVFKSTAGFGPANTFHGWRNTVETKLQRAREGQLQIDKYLGHASKGEGPRTYARLQPADLIETAAKVAYEDLKLPRAYKR